MQCLPEITELPVGWTLSPFERGGDISPLRPCDRQLPDFQAHAKVWAKRQFERSVTGPYLGIVVMQFKPGEARRLLEEQGQILSGCFSWSEQIEGVTVSMRVTRTAFPAHVEESQSWRIVLSAPGVGGGDRSGVPGHRRPHR